MTDLSFLWVVLAVVAVVLLAPRFKSTLRAIGRRGVGRGVDVEGDLLSACGGDKSMAERLIQHERERKPNLSRTGAALLALSRLRDDRR